MHIHKISLRLYLYDALYSLVAQSSFGKWLNRVLITLIIASVVMVSMETVNSIYTTHAQGFALFEKGIVALFTLEYLVRFWVCVENPLYRLAPISDNPILNAIGIRLQYMMSPGALVDSIAILPFYINLIFPTMGLDLLFLRALRLMRILKLSRYSPALQVFVTVLYRESRSMLAAFFVVLIMLMLSSSVIYVLEHKTQPEQFSSIPQSMWWAISTLTTVGYGDVTPVTSGGKIVGAVVMITGIGLFVLWTSILSGAFTEELRKHHFHITKDMLSKIPALRLLPLHAIRHIDKVAETAILPARHALIRRGERVDSLYFIVDGTVEIDNSTEREILQAGDHFAEAGLFNHSRAVVDVITLTSTRVFKIDAHTFQTLCMHHKDFYNHMKEVAQSRGHFTIKQGKITP